MSKLLNHFFKITSLFAITLLVDVVVNEAFVKRQGFVLAQDHILGMTRETCILKNNLKLVNRLTNLKVKTLHFKMSI